jgi:hypothetical protein
MRHLTLGLLLTLCALAPALAQQPVPTRSAGAAVPDAGATRASLEDVRILRAVNRVGFTPAQAAAMVGVVETWEGQRAGLENAGGPQISQLVADLRTALASGSEPPADVPAEAALKRISQERVARLEQSRRAAQAELARQLTQLPPEQLQPLLAVARELLAQSLLANPGGGRPGDSVESTLRTLEQLRQASPEAYARLRDATARRQAGAFDPASMRAVFQQMRDQRARGGADAGGPGGRRTGFRLPPVTDPAAQQRVNRIATELDQVRAMPPAAWQQQRAQIAAQLVRDRQSERAQNAGTDELVRLYIDQFLLQPRSLAALRARFP